MNPLNIEENNKITENKRAINGNNQEIDETNIQEINIFLYEKTEQKRIIYYNKNPFKK